VKLYKDLEISSLSSKQKDAQSEESSKFILKNQDEIEEEQYKQLIDRLGLEEEEIELLLRKVSKKYQQDNTYEGKSSS
jgi:cyanate lyase